MFQSLQSNWRYVTSKNDISLQMHKTASTKVFQSKCILEKHENCNANEQKLLSNEFPQLLILKLKNFAMKDTNYHMFLSISKINCTLFILEVHFDSKDILKKNYTEIK